MHLRGAARGLRGALHNWIDRIGGASRGARRLRFGIGILSSGLVAAGVTAFAWPSGAGADQSPGQGNSYAQSLQVTPHEGSLAVGAVFGEALAGHTNTFARAQSQGLDLGSVGLAMQGYNCGQPPNPAVYDAVPQPLQAETGQQGADRGQTRNPNKSNYYANEYVRADNSPYGEADTNYGGPFGDPSGAMTVSGLRSKSWSGVVNGVNEAGATSDVKSVSLGNGAVMLNGLHWKSVYPTGGKPEGSFTIGQAEIGGKPLPNSADLSAVESVVNRALLTVGLQVQLPRSTVDQGIESVSPLQVEVVPASARDALLDPAVTAVQPTYFQFTNGLENGFASDPPPYNALGPAESTPPGQQLAQGLCQSDTPITVLDITIASFDGGGFFNTAIGGVNASSATLPTNSYNLSLGFGSLSTPGAGELGSGTPGSLGTTGSLGVPGGGPGSAGGGLGQNAAAARALGRQRGMVPAGSMLAAGLSGLALLPLLVEADRRKMRAAQRTTIFEE